MRRTRRQFLQVGVAAAAGLALVRSVDQALATEGAGSLDLKFFANREAEVIAALAPAILAGALPEDPVSRAVAINEVVEAFDRAAAGLSPAIQGELRELFSLLTFGLTRRWIAGLPSPWNEATPEEVSGFLQGWRNSRYAPLQQGYQALVRLTVACWYGNPLSWDHIAYPGPPHAKELGLQ